MFTLRFDMRAPASGAPPSALYAAAPEMCAWAEEHGALAAVLRLREDDYVSGLPTGADVLLLIEVVDSSREYDRAKLPAYAQSGIPEVWLVDLQDQVLLSHRQPVGAEYRLVQALRIGDSITPQALPEQSFHVESILG